jgi:recombination DNA repair RAD52 pathway protein
MAIGAWSSRRCSVIAELDVSLKRGAPKNADGFGKIHFSRCLSRPYDRKKDDLVPRDAALANHPLRERGSKMP